MNTVTLVELTSQKLVAEVHGVVVFRAICHIKLMEKLMAYGRNTMLKYD